MTRLLLILLSILGGPHHTFHNVQASRGGHFYEATCIEQRLAHPIQRGDFVQVYGRGVCWFHGAGFVRVDALTMDGGEIVGGTIHV